MFDTPICLRIHSRVSATAVSIFGADRSPNGGVLSTKWEPFQEIPNNSQSEGWTGSSRYANLIQPSPLS